MPRADSLHPGKPCSRSTGRPRRASSPPSTWTLFPFVTPSKRSAWRDTFDRRTRLLGESRLRDLERDGEDREDRTAQAVRTQAGNGFQSVFLRKTVSPSQEGYPQIHRRPPAPQARERGAKLWICGQPGPHPQGRPGRGTLATRRGLSELSPRAGNHRRQCFT